MSSADEFPIWKELEHAMAEPGPHEHDAQDVVQHLIESELAEVTHYLLAVLKLIRLGVVTLDQVIMLAEARVIVEDGGEVE